MKLITSSKEMENEFLRLLESYAEYYWVVAWAGKSFCISEHLRTNKSKIRKIVVGIHFYQTHPEFISEYSRTPNVRFIKQPDGTFHPKLYLFQNNTSDWELLVGSTNFTNSAFYRNTEASILLSNESQDSKKNYRKATQFINRMWQNAQYFSHQELENYKEIWKIQDERMKSLSGTYSGTTTRSKPIFNIEILNQPWEIYVEQVKNDKNHLLDQRITLLDNVKEYFETEKHFNHLELHQRQSIAGTIDYYKGIDWGAFGSMRGSGFFQRKINHNNENLSKALDQIPLTSTITRSHYDSFLDYFARALPEKNFIAPATRLLAMKRPDVFVCLDGKNSRQLCEAFQIKKSDMTYDRYWNDVILRIFDARWWQEPKPRDDIEQKIARARSAFLDALFYEP